MALTNNDKKWGPFTVGPWANSISLLLVRQFRGLNLRLIAFGWVLQIALPSWVARLIKPDAAGDDDKDFGFSLNRMNGVKEGYTHLFVYWGLQTFSSNTSKSWCCEFPWKRWQYQRTSIYRPDGSEFASCGRARPGCSTALWDEMSKLIEACPKSVFVLRDYDGAEVVATCYIEEREWTKGEGCFRWLRWLVPNQIQRSLDIHFSAETGTEKGSWKGGTIGTSIRMAPGDTPLDGIKNYCAQEHRAKGRGYRMEFVCEKGGSQP